VRVVFYLLEEFQKNLLSQQKKQRKGVNFQKTSQTFMMTERFIPTIKQQKKFSKKTLPTLTQTQCKPAMK